MSFGNNYVEGNFRQLGFTPRGSLAMEAEIGDIQLTAVEHPLYGIALIFESFGARTARQFEIFMPIHTSVEQIAGLIYVNVRSVFSADQAAVCRKYLEGRNVPLFQ